MLNSAADGWWQWLLGLVIAGSAWMIRKILTNDKLIAIMQREVEDNHQELLRSNARLEKALDRQSDALQNVVKELHQKADRK